MDFPAPFGPEEPGHLARGDREVEPVEGADVAEALGEAGDLDGGLGGHDSGPRLVGAAGRRRASGVGEQPLGVELEGGQRVGLGVGAQGGPVVAVGRRVPPHEREDGADPDVDQERGPRGGSRLGRMRPAATASAR